MQTGSVNLVVGDTNHVRDIFVRAGFTASLLDTVDGGDQLPAGGIPGVFTGVNFGLGQHQKEMDKLAAFQPGKPLVVTEYWPGWFDYWGHPHQTRRLETQLEDLDYILHRGAGINLYMFHGGTSFVTKEVATQQRRQISMDGARTRCGDPNQCPLHHKPNGTPRTQCVP